MNIDIDVGIDDLSDFLLQNGYFGWTTGEIFHKNFRAGINVYRWEGYDTNRFNVCLIALYGHLGEDDR